LDSADVARAIAEQLRCQLDAQAKAHEEVLSQLKAERVVRVDEHNSILGEAEGRIRDQCDLIGLLQD